ncbi:MAG TPA: RidA family protein [Acidimicrobiales bacterium]|nr:RidA family protein [Acidimicrobiales bacterium]
MTKPLGPYSPIVRAGDWLVTSGQLGVRDGRLVEGGVEAQTAQAMANVRSLLEGEGAGMDDIVKATVFLADIEDWPLMNGPYLEALGDHRPARSAFAVAALPMAARVEIEVWAWVGG